MELENSLAPSSIWSARLQQSNSTPIFNSQYVFPRHRLQTSLKNRNRIPLVIVACGSYSPVTYLHLRMFEMAFDYVQDNEVFEIIGGYFSPVSDAYAKPGLAGWHHRVQMCELAVQDSNWIMVDPWEASQTVYTRTAKVLDHFEEELNGKGGGFLHPDGTQQKIRIMLLAGGDLIQSFAVPNLWKEQDRTGANVHDFLLTNDSLHIHRIRLFVKRGMSIRYLLPDPVITYLYQNRLYQPENP
ncbi:hypothetical protein EDD86DRAFT_232373 [Gorgonomyces haynaldii]|nr:hypothetical protein EDD86DRAFT_232373 [Gorgonomyces haynaldii]